MLKLVARGPGPKLLNLKFGGPVCVKDPPVGENDDLTNELTAAPPLDGWASQHGALS